MRIDVMRAEKNKFKVMVDFVQRGIELTSGALANQIATELKDKSYPQAVVHLMK